MQQNLKRKSQDGFSLMEMMIVLVMLMIILSAVFSLLRGTIKTSNTNYELTSAAQGLRNAQEFLNRDILTLGDGAKNTTNILLPTEFVTNYLTARSPAEIDPANRGFVSSSVVISDKNVPANTMIPGTNPSTSVLTATDRISFLTEDRTFLPIQIAPEMVDANNGSVIVPTVLTANFQAGEIYFISNGVTGTFLTITSVNAGTGTLLMQNGDALGLNQTGTAGSLWTVKNAEMPMNLMRVQLINYFVNAEQHLVRRVFGVAGSGFVDSVVSEHVVNLKFRYMLRPDSENGILKQPLSDFNLNDAASVRMIEPFVEVETAYPLQDGNKHKVNAVTQLAVRNLQFTEAPVPQDRFGNTD